MNDNDKYIALIIKHLSGETSANEEQMLASWLNENEVNKTQFNETKKAWELANEKIDPEVAAINIDDEWKKLSSTIGLKDNTKAIDFVPQKRKSFNWMKIAAAIAILLTIGSTFYFLSQPQKTSLIAKSRIIENKLPDGSNITLKEQSSLIYDKKYNEKERKVVLKGEAFFEVEPDKEKPFIVEAGNIVVKVLGTSFLVKNDEQNKISEVIVKEGTVLVYNTEDEQNKTTITAGEKASFNRKTSVIEKNKNLDKNYMAWKTKNLNFDSTSLQQAIQTINHAYNSDIVIKNDKLKNCKLTLTTENQSLESILRVIETTLDVKINKRGKKIEISGEGCANIPKN